MTGPEMLEEIERRKYYEERELENVELIDCMIYAGKLLFIAGCLCSIGQHLYELWRAFEI